MKHYFLLFIGSFILAPSCANESVVQEPDAGYEIICDPNNVIRLAADMRNCGACGNRCSIDVADHCDDGQCMCGTSPACPVGQGCRFGSCIEPDEGEPCESLADCVGIEECLDNHCLQICEFDSECAPGHACISSRCTFVKCVEEVCDGLDNDCDGVIDELPSGAPLSRWCYSGDEETIMLPCRRGVQVCTSMGTWSECEGEVAPVYESGLLACDGLDNDCDGCTDGQWQGSVCVSSEPEYFDIIYVIDPSGSMADKIEVVKKATSLFSERFAANPSFKFGIVLVPGMTDGLSEILVDLTDFAIFNANLFTIGSTGSYEPQWDAVYELATGELPISWRPNSVRIIILFTDEEGQSRRSFRRLGPDITETSMCDALTHGEVFVAVVTSYAQHDFDDCASHVFNLPSATSRSAASGTPCISDVNCSSSERCYSSQCVSEAVVEVATNLDTVISDPCR